MKIETIQNELIDEFSMFNDWMERYEYMIELGKSLPLIDAKYKTDENIIKGCQSKVWVHAELQDDKVVFTADSDAIITKGIIAVLNRRVTRELVTVHEIWSVHPPDLIVVGEHGGVLTALP